MRGVIKAPHPIPCQGRKEGSGSEAVGGKRDNDRFKGKFITNILLWGALRGYETLQVILGHAGGWVLVSFGMTLLPAGGENETDETLFFKTLRIKWLACRKANRGCGKLGKVWHFWTFYGNREQPRSGEKAGVKGAVTAGLKPH